MRKVMINGRWPLNLSDSSATEWEGNMAHHGGVWESERLSALAEEIAFHREFKRTRPVVLYIGAYKGDMPALLCCFEADLMLVEASPGFWPLIREVWEANHLPRPLACFSGLASARTSKTLYISPVTDWPERSAPFVEGTTGFYHLAEHGGHDPDISMDDFISLAGRIPDIVCMDVEGAEWEVLKGMERLLTAHKPKLFISVHPEFMFHNFNQYEYDMHAWLRERGYAGEHLAYHHEHHHFYYKPETMAHKRWVPGHWEDV